MPLNGSGAPDCRVLQFDARKTSSARAIQALADEIQLALRDPGVDVLILELMGWDDPADTDESLLLSNAAPSTQGLVLSVIAAIEQADKPVVAVLYGVVSGVLFDWALACRGRIAATSALVAFTDVAWGRIPGGGSLQRLVRLVGVPKAWEILHSGQALPARHLADSPLFYQVDRADAQSVACAYATELAHVGTSAQPAQRACDILLEDASTTATVAELRQRLRTRQRSQVVLQVILERLSAAAMPFETACAGDAQALLALQGGQQAQALSYLMRVQNAARTWAPPTTVEPRATGHIAVIGAGTMGSGIAIAALDAGCTVTLLERDPQALGTGCRRISEYYQGRTRAGRMKSGAAAQCEARLHPSTDWNALQAADVVIEAVFEDLEVKRAVFQKIDAHARIGAVLATNTSYLDIGAIAQATRRASEVLGLHFFSPAHVMKLLEVVCTPQTADDVQATGMALARRLGKTAVVSGTSFGFIGNRIYNAYRRQCECMLEDGAWPEEVDAALEAFGFAMGPFAVADLSGLDIAWRMRRAQAASRDPRERYVPILDHLCEQGRLGRKANAGYYIYADGKRAKTTDAVVRGIITAARKARGAETRGLAPSEIQQRALLAMANEAALVVAEGVARCAGDVDVVMALGYGFPRWEGGPLYWALGQDRSCLEQGLQALGSSVGYGFRAADFGSLARPVPASEG